MATHQPDREFFIAGIKRHGPYLLVADYPVHSRCYVASSFGVTIRQRNGIHLRRASHIEGGRRAHHAGTYH